MFLTWLGLFYGWCPKGLNVAIPSNRVNVSYLLWRSLWLGLFGRNPLKSGQCFLLKEYVETVAKTLRRNPLKSGQCFLRLGLFVAGMASQISRNPLKSGQCFLLKNQMTTINKAFIVAIPSNRVNVSYIHSVCV